MNGDRAFRPASIRSIPGSMTATSPMEPSIAEPGEASASITNRYYMAMAAPFAVDFTTSAAYVAINGQPLVLVPMMLVSAAFLIVGVEAGAWGLIRPVRRFLAGHATFAEIEKNVAALPRRSATLVGVFYAPMLALRLLSSWLGITFGS